MTNSACIATRTADRLTDNNQMHVGAMRIACVMSDVIQRGFDVIGIQYSRHGTPTIQVAATAQCREMIERGDACYYIEGPGKRSGQFKIDGVRVIWTELGH